MFDAPTTVARIPRNAIPYSLARRMTPNGVQGRRRGRFCASNPVLTGWNPSTSLAGSIESMTRLVSTPFPSGNCTRIPSTRSSRLSLLTRSSNCASPVAAGRSCAKDSMPTSRDALRLLRTYTEDAGSWPTCTTANPGRRPWLAANSLARVARAATQVHQAAFGQQNQPLAVGEDDVVDLRLDVLPRILLEARHVDLVVEVADVAHDRVVLHAQHVIVRDDVEVARRRHEN